MHQAQQREKGEPSFFCFVIEMYSTAVKVSFVFHTAMKRVM